LRQSALIRRWRPWLHSTGPKSEAGKAVCAANAMRHGNRSRAAELLELSYRALLYKIKEYGIDG